MTKSKTVAAKGKAVTPKKVTARRSISAAKPIKLGGVPNQGKVIDEDSDPIT